MEHDGCKKKDWALAAYILVLLVLAPSVEGQRAASLIEDAAPGGTLNPVDGSDPLQCPEGSEPRVYLLDMTMLVHPSHFGEYEYGDYYFYFEMYQQQDDKITDWFGEPENDNYRKESDTIIQYNTCGARGQLVPDNKGSYHAVMHSHALKGGIDSCNLWRISERPIDLKADKAWAYTATFNWEDEQVGNQRRLHGAWYGLLQEHRADTDYLVPKVLPESPSTSLYPVLMCTATEQVEVVLFVENAQTDWWDYLDPREWWSELTEELYGQPMIYQAHVSLDDSPETIDQIFSVSSESQVNYQYFFNRQNKEVTSLTDIGETTALIFVPQLPSLSIFGTAISNAIDSVWGISNAINPLNWLKAVFAIAWGVMLFMLMAVFHYVKTYLFLAVVYLLWMEVLFQLSIVGGRANIPVAAFAYISGFLMVAGSFLILLVDWTGWFL